MLLVDMCNVEPNVLFFLFILYRMAMASSSSNRGRGTQRRRHDVSVANVLDVLNCDESDVKGFEFEDEDDSDEDVTHQPPQPQQQATQVGLTLMKYYELLQQLHILIAGSTI